MEKVRKFLTFTGRVQGVGFRYTAEYLAQSIGLTGWVRNEWDGSVAMEVQGTEEQIDLLIKKLRIRTVHPDRSCSGTGVAGQD